MLSISSGAASDVGRVRAVNEDSLFVSDALVAVADGMGGHAAGDVASRIAVTCLERLVDHTTLLRPDDLVTVIGDANDEIVHSAEEDTTRAGMGTTLAGVAVVAVGGTDHWVVFNVGDSRVYRLDDEGLSQVTTDHSEVQELVAAGLLRPEEAKDHPNRNIVTRSLGTDPGPQADLWVFPPSNHERFLVCSDGLPLELTAKEITAVLRDEPDPQRAADALVAAAVAAGGRDNVTAVIVDGVLPESPTGVDVTAPRPIDPKAV
jgi:serine/threonine protein phosphatase PrpC